MSFVVLLSLWGLCASAVRSNGFTTESQRSQRKGLQDASRRAAESIMRWIAPLFLLCLAGCSTAPIADFLDFFKPGRLGPEQTPPYGGVCGPACVAPSPASPMVPPPSAQGPIPPSGPSQIAPPLTPGPPP